MKHDTHRHTRPSPGAPGATRSANNAISELGALDGSDGCAVSPLIPHLPFNGVRKDRLLDDTSSEPEETALSRDDLPKVWRTSAESARASRLESGTSVTTAAAGASLPRKRCALPPSEPPAVRQRTDTPSIALSLLGAPSGGSTAPIPGAALPPAGAAASMALLAYTNQLYTRLEGAVAAKIGKLESQINVASQSRQVGAMLGREAADATALRMAALERRCADLEARELDAAAEQSANREHLEAAVAAVTGLVGAAVGDAAATRSEAAALREMAKHAYATLLADVSASINALKAQMGELKAQQDEVGEAVAAWRSTTAAPAVSSESMRASKPQ